MTRKYANIVVMGFMLLVVAASISCSGAGDVQDECYHIGDVHVSPCGAYLAISLYCGRSGRSDLTPLREPDALRIAIFEFKSGTILNVIDDASHFTPLAWTGDQAALLYVRGVAEELAGTIVRQEVHSDGPWSSTKVADVSRPIHSLHQIANQTYGWIQQETLFLLDTATGTSSTLPDVHYWTPDGHGGLVAVRDDPSGLSSRVSRISPSLDHDQSSDLTVHGQYSSITRSTDGGYAALHRRDEIIIVDLVRMSQIVTLSRNCRLSSDRAHAEVLAFHDLVDGQWSLHSYDPEIGVISRCERSEHLRSLQWRTGTRLVGIRDSVEIVEVDCNTCQLSVVWRAQ